MRGEDREQLFWALSEIGDRATRDDAPVSDAALDAYREGRLTAEEASEVERLLVRNPAARRRLEELAGLTPPAATERLRQRVVARASEPGAGFGRRPSRLRRRTRWLGLAAAAVVVTAVGWMMLRSPPAIPAYEVRIAALTERRGPAEPDSDATAFADTPVTITATVAGTAVAGVDAGLYRVLDQRFERVPTGDRDAGRNRRGVVVFETLAADLVGSFSPGLYEIFVVITEKGDLPATVPRDPGRDPAAALAAGGRRQVHRLTLRLLP